MAAFLNLPFRLQTLAEKSKVSRRGRAVTAQMAVAIGLLQMCPIRLGNLAGFTLERQLQRLALDEDASIQALLVEGINAVFQTGGLSRIA